jgi:hypothetical protein
MPIGDTGPERRGSAGKGHDPRTPGSQGPFPLQLERFESPSGSPGGPAPTEPSVSSPNGGYFNADPQVLSRGGFMLRAHGGQS